MLDQVAHTRSSHRKTSCSPCGHQHKLLVARSGGSPCRMDFGPVGPIEYPRVAKATISTIESPKKDDVRTHFVVGDGRVRTRRRCIMGLKLNPFALEMLCCPHRHSLYVHDS
jgi:hypothetical protein